MNDFTQIPNPLNGTKRFGSGQPDSGEHPINWHDYLRIFFRSRYIIAICFLLVVFITAIMTYTTEPVYVASARIMLEDKGGMGASLFDFTTMVKKETMINNQVEILKSRSLAEHVIKNLVVLPEARRLRILGYDSKSMERYKRDAIDPAKADSIRFANLLEQNERWESAVDQLRRYIIVAPIRNTDMIEISVHAFSPFESAFLANSVALAFQEMSQEDSQAEVRQVKNFLEDQLQQIAKELSQSEEALRNYQEQARVVALDQETNELVSKVAQFETQYNEAKTAMEATKQRLAYIDQELNRRQLNFDVETISTQPYLEELKRRIAEKEAQLAIYISQMIEKNAYTTTQAEVERQNRQIDALKQKFKEEVSKIAAAEFVDPAIIAGSLFTSKIEVETELQALRPKVEEFGKILQRYNEEMEKLPDKSLRLARLIRTAQVNEKLYVMLQEKYQESRITEVGQLGNVRVIDQARPPRSPVKPQKQRNMLLGVLLGLGLGIGIAFLREYMDNTVHRIEDIENLRLPVVASIPFIKPEHNNGMLTRLIDLEDPQANDINERLVTHLKPRSPISESYRALRTNLLFSAPDNPKHIVMITSSGPREGKSTSIANLAITFAQMGTKTLLIDADLRRPMLHKLFRMDKQPGLTNILVGRIPIEQAIRNVEDIPNLDILSCGILPPNPAEMLGSSQMYNMLTSAKSIYGMILIDAPPVIAVTDPSVLAANVDGVILVVRSGVAQREAVIRATEQLGRVNAPLLGVLLNGIQTSDVYGSYYYYYHYHYYYGADGQQQKKRPKKRQTPKES